MADLEAERIFNRVREARAELCEAMADAKAYLSRVVEPVVEAISLENSLLHSSLELRVPSRVQRTRLDFDDRVLDAWAAQTSAPRTIKAFAEGCGFPYYKAYSVLVRHGEIVKFGGWRRWPDRFKTVADAGCGDLLDIGAQPDNLTGDEPAAEFSPPEPTGTEELVAEESSPAEQPVAEYPADIDSVSDSSAPVEVREVAEPVTSIPAQREPEHSEDLAIRFPLRGPWWSPSSTGPRADPGRIHPRSSAHPCRPSPSSPATGCW